MKKKIKFRLSSFIFITTCLLVFFASLYIFWKDLNSMSVRDDKMKIATIEYKYKIAQRKFSDRVAWERLQQNSALYNEDTIRTADNAMARITFKNNTVIEIHEATMLQIFYSDESGVNLSLGGGNVSVDTSSAESEVSVTFSNGQQFKLEQGSRMTAGSNVEAGGSNNIAVHYGAVSYESDEGPVEIGTGETVRIAESGEVQKVPVSITSVSRNVHLLSFDESSKTVQLEWSTSETSETVPVIVETSFDKNFEAIEDRFVVDSTSSLNLETPVGRLYWRVYVEDNKEEAVEGKITVDAVKEVEPISPANGRDFSNRSGKSNVAFSWSGNEYAAYYELEVSKTPDFALPVVKKEVRNTSIVCNDLETGDYFWRVTPFYTVNDEGYGKASETQSFKVSKTEFSKPPVLATPADNSRITVTDSGVDINFQWRSFTEDKNYVLFVASDEDFKNVVYSQVTDANKALEKFEASKLPAGDYYWKVVSAKESGEDGNLLESAVRKFTSVKYVPGENKLVYPPDNFAVEAAKIQTVDFMWKLADEYIAGKNSSVLQISRNEDFTSNTVNMTLPDSYVSGISIPGGNYWWRIGVIKSDSEIVYTKPNYIKVLEELGVPLITSPVLNSTVAVQNENTVTVQWQSVAGADYYNVKIYSGDRLLKEGASVYGTEARISLPSNIFEAGDRKNLRCNVQAIAKESEAAPGRNSRVAECSFTLRKPVNVKLVSPSDSDSIDGLAALRNPVAFTWEAGDKPDNVQFVLKKMQPSGAMQTVRTVENPGATVKIEGLTSGTYEWTIKASLKDGYSLDAESSYSFTVKPVPELPGARLTAPYMNQVINSDYLVANKAITFKWNAVPGATDYQFVLYQRLPGGRLKRIAGESTRRTEVKIRDLTILDIGNFEWHITAYSHARDGREEQRSRASIGRFEINFGIPDKVETYDPGIMYGE